MSKQKYRRKLLAFVPDTADVDLEAVEADVEAVVTEASTEEQVEVAYKCTACFDHLTAEEVRGNINDCPNCKETDVLIEA